MEKLEKDLETINQKLETSNIDFSKGFHLFTVLKLFTDVKKPPSRNNVYTELGSIIIAEKARRKAIQEKGGRAAKFIITEIRCKDKLVLTKEQLKTITNPKELFR